MRCEKGIRVYRNPFNNKTNTKNRKYSYFEFLSIYYYKAHNICICTYILYNTIIAKARSYVNIMKRVWVQFLPNIFQKRLRRLKELWGFPISRNYPYRRSWYFLFEFLKTFINKQRGRQKRLETDFGRFIILK